MTCTIYQQHFLHPERGTYIGSSEAVLISSISCACLNEGSLASTGIFSDMEKKHNSFHQTQKHLIHICIIHFNTLVST